MPIYTYQCEECGVRFDARQRFSDDPISVCPECGGATHKVIGPVGVVFKGSGFYVTDSRSNNSALGAGKKEDSADSSTSADKTPAESKKPESKSTAD
jgi:putative FmdB family regulatory protein